MLKFKMASTDRLNIFRKNKMCIKINGHILSKTFPKELDVQFFFQISLKLKNNNHIPTFKLSIKTNINSGKKLTF